MGQKPAQSPNFAGSSIGLFVLLAAATPQPAFAQHADAGVQQKAATPPRVPTAEPPHAEGPAPGDTPSGVLPKLIDPSQLSEGTRARLAERAAGRHPSALPTRQPEPRLELPQQAAPAPAASVPHHSPSARGGEPLRRGQARLRVQAVETDEGVTLLSNRIPLPESRIMDAVARRPLPEPEPRGVEATLAAADPSSVTETHSLRPGSSRGSSYSAKKDASTGLGWLLWPFVLFVTTSAVVGSLWFRKKTE